MALRLLISDFDGTLADTFEANYLAYAEAFGIVGLSLSKDVYRQCFGYRFDRFMDSMEIFDTKTRNIIRNHKADCYPNYMRHLKVNRTLLDLIRRFRMDGGKTAIASTAREKNLRNALRHINAENDFDLILAGESVTCGKPDPEIYLSVLHRLGIPASDALVFEDSEVGFNAAEAAGIKYFPITNSFFSDGN